jgi:DNA-binding NarL/FixJ family response regulator
VKKILIIEDDRQTRENLATILEMEGYQPCPACSGQEGLALATTEKPDLVLCDVSMPDLDGYDVLRCLRKDARNAALPFIFLTGRGERNDLRTGMNLGADDYLVKPVTATELLTAVAARIEREALRGGREFKPDFSSAEPLRWLGLTQREAEVLLWVAQGKSNGEIATIIGVAENTVKKHAQSIFEKLGIESRHAATVRALEVLTTRRGD